MGKPTIALDFDGVVHACDGAWTNSHDVNDAPVPGALNFIRSAIDGGFHVVLHTARALTASVVPHIYAWLAKHGLEERYTWTIAITALKPAPVVAYIDDHGWRFEGTFPDLEVLRNLKPWNRP